MTKIATRKIALKAVLGTFLTVGLCDVALASEVDETHWTVWRTALFGDRPIHRGKGVIDIEAPVKAEDPALVPVTVSPGFKQTPERYIRTITLLVDKNPVPRAATFHLSPLNGLAKIATRVRVNEFSYVRAVAETNDGKLYMSKQYVKAYGGCSAPPLKDYEEALTHMGTMKLRHIGGAKQGEPSLLQLHLSHPNHNGMQITDMVERHIPARYVRDIEVRYAGEQILRMEGDVSLSEDPRLRFYYVPDEAGAINVEVQDTEGDRFTKEVPVKLRNPLG